MSHPTIVILIGGPRDGAVVPVDVSYFPDGTMCTVLASSMRPDHLEVYWGGQPLDDLVPMLPFSGWASKDLSPEGAP